MIGKSLSHYNVREELGRGGMGIVYKAEDSNLHRFVAIKVLPPQIVASEEEKSRFIREARAAAALNHPNIATVHDLGETDEGQLFIVMELVEGETLSDRIKDATLTIEEAISITKEAASGLHAAHEAGIVHRDVKPSNIIISNQGHVKILDFGLSKMAGTLALTKTRSTLGTAAYMSPEQARGDVVEKESDIWSLGVVLYEMLTGRRPFTGEYEAAIAYSILNTEPDIPESYRPDLNAGLSTITMRALNKDAAERFASMDELRIALEGLAADHSASVLQASGFGRRRTAVVGLVAVGALAIAAVLFFRSQRSERVLWAQQTAMPEIERLAGIQEYQQAFDLALDVEQIIPNDSGFTQLWSKFSGTFTFDSDPPGADVLLRAYDETDAEWFHVGQTPVENFRYPYGYRRLRFEKEGYVTVDVLPSRRNLSRDVALRKAGSRYSEMVDVPEYTDEMYNLLPVGLDHLGREPFKASLIDRDEVSNRAFKEFVDAGGYEDQTYWKQPFTRDGHAISWEEGITQFLDQTGRPGPSTWEVQDYPDDQDDYPVTGVSWYEAAAYAEYVGKELPTVFQWSAAASVYRSAQMVPLSNFSDAGPSAAGTYEGISAFGLRDAAGNAREWMVNGSGTGEQHYLLGGGYSGSDFSFTDAFAISAWDRSETNGIRLAVYPEVSENQKTLTGSLPLAFRDYAVERPVGDAEFAAIRRQYEYDDTPLHADIEKIDDSADDWTRETITFVPAYEGERMLAYVFTPKRGTPPYQTVVIFPGSGAIHGGSSASLAPTWQSGIGEFVLKSGRAFVFPVYTSTYERSDDLRDDYGNESVYYRDRVIRWALDLRRTIDYLETRDDIDMSRLGYYGFSWGAASGAIMTVVEPRFRASVFYVAGLYPSTVRPEVDPFNFLSRVTIPTLMLNGRYDFFYPYETSQLPLFNNLGTPDSLKDYFVFEGGHDVPRKELITRTLAWYDRYLGLVE